MATCAFFLCGRNIAREEPSDYSPSPPYSDWSECCRSVDESVCRSDHGADESAQPRASGDGGPFRGPEGEGRKGRDDGDDDDEPLDEVLRRLEQLKARRRCQIDTCPFAIMRC